MEPVYVGRHDGFFKVGPLPADAAGSEYAAVAARVADAKLSRFAFLTWEVRAGAGWLLSALEPRADGPDGAVGSAEETAEGEVEPAQQAGPPKKSDGALLLSALEGHFASRGRPLVLLSPRGRSA